MINILQLYGDDRTMHEQTEILSRMDVNHDGKVSFQEICKYFAKHPLHVVTAEDRRAKLIKWLRLSVVIGARFMVAFGRLPRRVLFWMRSDTAG